MADENKLTYQELSKRTWTPPSVTESGLQLGALLRIAAATEVMAQDYNRLLADIRYLRNHNAALEAQLKTERRRSASRLGRIRRILKAKGLTK
jgi:hypothetical protein